MAAVVVAEDVWGPALEDLAQRVDTVFIPDGWRDIRAVVAAAAGASVLVVRDRIRVDEALLDQIPTVRLIARAGAGLDNVDMDAAKMRGVEIVSTPGANAASVAEMAIGLIICLARRITLRDSELRRGVWDRTPGREVRGKKLALFGFGATGRATARLAVSIGMPTIAVDPAFDSGDDPLLTGVRQVTADQARAEADFLCLHLPLTAATDHFVDAQFLTEMRPTSFLINLSRGRLVDEDALCQALARGAIAGAALDVREIEPSQPGRLERLENLVLTPHIGGATFDAHERINRDLTEAIASFLDLTIDVS